MWLTQEEIARLFEVQRPAITKHIKNIFATEELQEDSVCSILELTARDGKKYKTKLYNLDLILSVGCRVNSKSATQFRIWATNVLKQYLTHCYALNKQVLLEQQAKAQALQQAIGLLSRLAVQDGAGIPSAILVLGRFSKGLSLLDDYDHKQLDEQGVSSTPAVVIQPEEFWELINQMKPDFALSFWDKPSFSWSGSIIKSELYKKVLPDVLRQRYGKIFDWPLLVEAMQTGKASLFLR